MRRARHDIAKPSAAINTERTARRWAGTRAACPPSPAGIGARAGFTLLELMVVTAILAVLAGVVAGPVLKAREKARDAVARIELRHAMRAIDLYDALHGRTPETLSELETADFAFGPDIRVCGFTRVGGGTAAESVALQVQHRASRTLLETRHPAWSGRIEERSGRCSGADGNGRGRGGGNRGGRGSGNPGSGGGAEGAGNGGAPGAGRGRGNR